MTLIQKLVLEMGYEEKKAKSMIMAGLVLVNNEPIIISSQKIKQSDLIRIKESKTWVSRGALKLVSAFENFNINVLNKICLDIGSSTGGFTQVLLENGAKKIYALDVGTNQLNYSLRTNAKVKSIEKTNLKTITPSMFNEKISFVCCDVSFISIKHVFNVLNFDLLEKDNDLVFLIKPQFEANSSYVEERGYVDEKYHQELINNIINFGKDKGFKLFGLIKSPILGNKSKNIEYLGWFRLV